MICPTRRRWTPSGFTAIRVRSLTSGRAAAQKQEDLSPYSSMCCTENTSYIKVQISIKLQVAAPALLGDNDWLCANNYVWPSTRGFKLQAFPSQSASTVAQWLSNRMQDNFVLPCQLRTHYAQILSFYAQHYALLLWPDLPSVSSVALT